MCWSDTSCWHKPACKSCCSGQRLLAALPALAVVIHAVGVRCRRIAAQLNLTENADWQRICLGGAAFYEGIADLSEYVNATSKVYRPARYCDLFAAGLSGSSERSRDLGLRFTRPIIRSSVAALVHAPVKVRGMWAFFQPLSWSLWLAMAAAMLSVPLVVVTLELLFKSRCDGN